MMSVEREDLVDWGEFETAREELGAGFARILMYFREDGAVSVERIEAAMHANDAVGLVTPAHTLKGEALQFGARPLSELAETIELTARHCLETQETPDELVPQVAELRPVFEATLALFEEATNPLVQRRSAAEDNVAATRGAWRG